MTRDIPHEIEKDTTLCDSNTFLSFWRSLFSRQI
jgi:hypothetical protein